MTSDEAVLSSDGGGDEQLAYMRPQSFSKGFYSIPTLQFEDLHYLSFKFEFK